MNITLNKNIKHIISTLIFSIILFMIILIPSKNIFAMDLDTLKVTKSGNQLSVSVEEDGDTKTSMNKQTQKFVEIFTKYKKTLGFLMAIAGITMIAIFISHFVSLATVAAEHPIIRRKNIIGMLWSGISAAILGSTLLILSLFYNLFN